MKDFHIEKAAELFNLPEEKVNREMRNYAKQHSYVRYYTTGPMSFKQYCAEVLKKNE